MIFTQLVVCFLSLENTQPISNQKHWKSYIYYIERVDIITYILNNLLIEIQRLVLRLISVY